MEKDIKIVNIPSSPAKVRKNLSADSLINMVRNNFKQISDYRTSLIPGGYWKSAG